MVFSSWDTKFPDLPGGDKAKEGTLSYPRVPSLSNGPKLLSWRGNRGKAFALKIEGSHPRTHRCLYEANYAQDPKL